MPERREIGALNSVEDYREREKRRHFEGLLDVTDRFLATFYEAFDVRFVAEEFITTGEHVVAIGRIEGTTRKTAVPVDVPFVHVWTVRERRLQRLLFGTSPHPGRLVRTFRKHTPAKTALIAYTEPEHDGGG